LKVSVLLDFTDGRSDVLASVVPIRLKEMRPITRPTIPLDLGDGTMEESCNAIVQRCITLLPKGSNSTLKEMEHHIGARIL